MTNCFFLELRTQIALELTNEIKNSIQGWKNPTKYATNDFNRNRNKTKHMQLGYEENELSSIR